MNQGKNNFLILIVIIAVFLAGYLWNKVRMLEEKNKTAATPSQISQQNQSAAQEKTEMKIKTPSKEDHWRGDQKVRYVWVEYSDLECPFCQKIHADMIKLSQTYKGKMTWVYRHYPLPFHSKAQKSAEAAECAGELGAKASPFLGEETSFWRMTDLIFEKMPEMTLSDLPNLAAQIGLNQKVFQSCLDSGKYEKKVKDQYQEGADAGASGTPTGVIYDMRTGRTQLVGGAQPYESLKSELETFIKKQEK